MKQTGTLLALLVFPTALVADSPESLAKESNKTSAHISAMIKAELPGYAPQPAPSPVKPPESSPALTHDPDILELDKITVREKPPQKIEPLDILTLSARKRKLALDFKNSFKGLDGLLNGFSFPIFSPSMAERGRVYHRQQQLEDLNRVASAVRESDPKASAELKKDAADAKRAIDQQNRPAGSN